MNHTKCRDCGLPLGNFLYADDCPHCHKELKQNVKAPSPPAPLVPAAKAWPFVLLNRVLRFVER